MKKSLSFSLQSHILKFFLAIIFSIGLTEVIAQPLLPPTAIEGYSTAGSITLSWVHRPEVDDYLFDVSTTSDFSTFVSGYNNASASNYGDYTEGMITLYNNILPNTIYYYRLRARYGSTQSVSSNVIAIPTPPLAPILTTTNITANSFTANWSSVPGATSYYLDVARDYDFTDIVNGYYNFPINGLSATLTGLSGNTHYYYRVHVMTSSNGASEYSSAEIVFTRLPPVAIEGYSTSSSITLNWGQIQAASGYVFDISTSSDFSTFVPGYNNTSTSLYGEYPNSQITVTENILPSTTYYYRLRARYGSATSANSNVIVVSTPPLPPVSIAATNITVNSFTANWNSVPGAISYRLDVSPDYDFAGMLAGYENLIVNGTSAPVTGLSGGVEYYYRLRVITSFGGSEYSSAIIVKTIPLPPIVLPSTNVTQTSFVLNWSPATGAGSYILDLATDDAFINFVSGYNALPVTGTSKAVAGLTPGSTYYSRLRSVNSSGISAYSTIGRTGTKIPYLSVNENYIITSTVTVPGITGLEDANNLAKDHGMVNVIYYDGLGRAMQNVEHQASPDQKDIVTPIQYGESGRQERKYLPFAITNSYNFPIVPISNQASYYNPVTVYNNNVKTDAAPYEETLYERSPLNRIAQQGAPGSVWQPQSNLLLSRAIKFEYHITSHLYPSEEDPEYEVLPIWSIMNVEVNDRLENILTTSAGYGGGMLRIAVSTDENNRITRQYTDKQGKVIAKKVQYTKETPRHHVDSDWAITYYVYDDFDRLRFVLQPEFWTATLATYSALDDAGKDAHLKKFAFEYQYDKRGRMVFKRVPGGGYTEYVYDHWDRLRLIRDAVQRAASTQRWSFIKYDALNRPIITGEFNSTWDRVSMISQLASLPARNEVAVSGNSVGYTLNNTYPTISINEIHSITYYDDYSFLSSLGLGTAYNFQAVTGVAAGYHSRVSDQVTCVKERILGQNSWLVTVNYYDDRYRIVQTVSDDHLSNKNRSTNAYYGITDWVTKAHVQHGSVVTSLTETEYDHRGRVLKIFNTMDSGPRVLISNHRYNDLGQLIEKNIHSTNEGASFLQSNDYHYNIRGWLTHINNSTLTNDGTHNDDAGDLFGVELKYDEQVTVNGTPTTPQFNGNISSIQWKTTNPSVATNENIFGYIHDPLNRLQAAKFASKKGSLWMADPNTYNEEGILYDRNGNIQNLNRSVKLGGAKTQIDSLIYRYSGNRLTNVHDNSGYHSSTAGNVAYGFVEVSHSNAITEYSYDGNGNMTSDLNKGITLITYNHLNLPSVVQFENNRRIEFLYSASGTKLQTKTKSGSSLVSQSDYVPGDIQYENSQLAFALTPEGRVLKKATSGWDYEYFHKDHLGNTRVVYGWLPETDFYVATMEPENAAAEDSIFRNVTIRSISGSINKTPPTADVPYPDHTALVMSTVGRTIGPAKMLQVAQGDRLNMKTYAMSLSGANGNIDIITGMATILAGNFGIVNVGESQSIYNAFQNFVPGFSASVGISSTVPKAYLCYVLFNNDYTDAQFGFHKLDFSGFAQWQLLNLDVTVPFDGHMYIFTANESKNSECYFDQLKITHEKTNYSLQITQANEYYPFGWTFNPYQRENHISQKLKFQGQERISDFNLNWDSFKWRNHQPDIGRFFNIDPLAESFYYNSSYAFSENKVTSHIELEGLEAWDIKNEWNEGYAQKYGSYVWQRTREIQDSGVECTCEDFAVNVLIDFASENNLPVTFENGTGTYDASNSIYTDIETFRNDVLKSTGAVDLNNTTTEIPKTAVAPGDIFLQKNNENRINHTQVVTGVTDDVITIKQGNFKEGLELLWHRSSNPKSSFYIGTEIQNGTYLRINGDYIRNGNRTEGMLNSDRLQARKWDFTLFNFRHRIHQATQKK